MRKQFTGGAPTTTLNGAINNTALSIVVASGTGYPTGTNPFVIAIDRGLSTEEKVLCTARSGNTITVDAAGRGYDGTTAVSHSDGATVEHTIDSIVIDEMNEHANDDVSDAHAAENISFTPAGTVAATDVQAAIVEVSGDVTTTNTAVSDLDDRVSDLEDAPSEGVIAYIAYAPGTIQSISAEDTIADVDATNLAITFTAPPSGEVLVTLGGTASAGSSSYTELSWALREGSTTITSLRIAAGGGNTTTSGNVTFMVLGLTPGNSYTYKWAHQRTSGSQAATTIYGGARGSALMFVQALP